MKHIFDSSVLKNLRDLEKQINQDIVSEMITEFISETGISVKEMRISLSALRFVEIAKIAHTLKSSSANIGAVAISNLCEKIESLIMKEKNHDIEQLNSLLSELESILSPTLEQLKAA